MRTLITRLAGSNGPVLRWEDGAGASLEPTGPVLANWVYKSAGLLSDLGVGPDTDLGLVDAHGLHWRALAGALAAGSLGATVRGLSPIGDGPAGPWVALAHEDAAVDGITASAEEVLVYAAAPLALSVDVPAGFTDFSSAVRGYPDQAVLAERSSLDVGDAYTHETVDLRESASAGSHGAETVVARLPATAGEWQRILSGLLDGVLVLRA